MQHLMGCREACQARMGKGLSRSRSVASRAEGTVDQGPGESFAYTRLPHLEATSPSPADWGEEGEAADRTPRAHLDPMSCGQLGGLEGPQPPKEGEAPSVMVSSLPWD